MTDENLTEVVCIIDESGSMRELTDDTVGGFNSFLEEQKEDEEEVKLTLTKFSTDHTVVFDGVDIEEVSKLNKQTYCPGGGTALMDAVSETIDNVGERLAKTKEENRPGKVLVMIITDGEENSSQEYIKEDVKERVEEQRNVYDWEFMFLGANIDAFSEARNIGIGAADTAQYNATKKGTQQAWGTVSQTITRYKKTGQKSVPDKIEEEQDTEVSS